MFYSTTFAPAFERERRSKMMKQTFRKKVPKNLEIKKKSLPLQPQSRNDSDKSSLRDLHNSTSSTSIRKINFPD